MPTAIASPASATFVGRTQEPRRKWDSTHQRIAVARDPHVPGPGFSRPAPKKVATAVANRGAAPLPSAATDAVSLLIGPIRLRLGSKFIFRVFQWCTDNVLTDDPIAQVCGRA